MPIKHLQLDRPAAFPCIGKLRKGGEKQTNTKGKEVMGRDLDHFRFTTDDTDAATAFNAYYGAEPKAVNVFLPYATADENFQAWMEEYRAGGLVRRCDGETCVFSRDAKGVASTLPAPCARPCGCKQVGRLSVIIPELVRMAYVTVETHSVYDIIQLTENLHAAQAMRGDLRGIPFILSRREREISTPTGDGGRARRKKSLLFIEPDPSWVARQLESMRLAALPQIGTPLLAAPQPRLLVDRQTGEILNGDTQWADPDDEEDDGEGENGNNPFLDKPDAGSPPPPAPQNGKKATPLSPTTAVRLYELARQIYGERWDRDKERQVAEGASKGVVGKLADLTQGEGEGLLAVFEKRLASMTAAGAEQAGQMQQSTIDTKGEI
ncbi:MAG: hypothetical protein KAX65_12655 [Caldilineaceae bacterium]|nr:hypothetical protein [Caldilineaceae bacterium]